MAAERLGILLAMGQKPPGSRRPNPNRIEMGAAYSVEVLGAGLRYIEGDKTMLIDSEVLTTPKTIAVNAGSINGWDAPHDAELIDDQGRTQIVQRIQLAFDTKGWILQVTWPFGETQPDGTWQWSSEGRQTI
jgi:hypothetical protein